MLNTIVDQEHITLAFGRCWQAKKNGLSNLAEDYPILLAQYMFTVELMKSVLTPPTHVCSSALNVRVPLASELMAQSYGSFFEDQVEMDAYDAYVKNKIRHDIVAAGWEILTESGNSWCLKNPFF